LRPILGNGFVVGVVSALVLEHLVLGCGGTDSQGKSA